MRLRAVHHNGDELISASVTRIERDSVAAVLAELADGTAPSMIARRWAWAIRRWRGSLKRRNASGGQFRWGVASAVIR